MSRAMRWAATAIQKSWWNTPRERTTVARFSSGNSSSITHTSAGSPSARKSLRRSNPGTYTPSATPEQRMFTSTGSAP